MRKRTIAKMYTYKYNDRLLRTIYQLNNDASVALVDNLWWSRPFKTTECRNGNSILTANFVYNVRFCKSITGALISQTLHYQEAITETLHVIVEILDASMNSV